MVVSAKLPDKKLDPEAWHLIAEKKLTIHGCKPDKCANLDGTCRKGYPYPVFDRTQIVNGRFEYERKEEDKNTVPTNYHLMRLIRGAYEIGAHANVLLVTGSFMLKYLAKYMAKIEAGVRLTPKDFASY